LAQKSFRCKVVTPSAALADDTVSYASVPLHDGLMGFLPGRAPILAKLGVGELRLTIAEDSKGHGGERSFVVAGGFAKMGDGVLTILAEQAVKGEEVSLADAEAELQKALSETPKDASPAAADALREKRNLARAKVALAKSAKGI
jgi:F-type H+-transporting ATPase subunit epsilon